VNPKITHADDGWFKSSFCSNASCVEVNLSEPGLVQVRDGKNRHGGRLAFSPDVWRDFVTTVADN
jgi:hypothetical protein